MRNKFFGGIFYQVRKQSGILRALSQNGSTSVRTFLLMGVIFVLATPLFLLMHWSSANAQGQGRHKLRDHVPHAATQDRFLRNAEGSKVINLAIGLPLRDEKGLQERIKDIYNPKSSQYHHYLTPDQFTAEFGPTEAEYQKVIDFVKSQGLMVTETHSDRILLGVKGTAADIQKAFQVNLRHYQREDKSEFYAPDQEPSVDADLPVLHISGLNNFNIPRHAMRIIKDPAGSVRALSKGRPNLSLKSPPPEIMAKAVKSPKVTNVVPLPPTGSGPTGLFTGNDFRSAYVPGTCSAMTGTNQTVALVEFEGFYQSDITAYELNAVPPLPNVPVTPVLVDGYNGIPDNNPPYQPGGFLGECTLDIDMVVSMAPGLSNIYVYEGPNNSIDSVPSNQMSYDQVANDVLNAISAPPAGVSLSNQVSCSWFGFGDINTTAILMKMAAQGQSFFMASGDFGSYVSGEIYPTPPMPYNDPNGEVNWMITVGGTELYTNGPNGTWTGETTWDDPTAYFQGAGNGAGSGGGVCGNVVIPFYQTEGTNLSWALNGGSSTHRNIPDVSMVADWLYIIVNGQGMGIGGTSASAPLWAGFMALINQSAQGNGLGPIGFANPAFYSWGNQSTYPGLFHDINDQSTNFFWWFYYYYPFPGLPYTAYNGYDLATGWGSPQCNLISALMNNAPTFTPTPCPPNTAPDLSWNPKATMTIPRSRVAVDVINNLLYAVGGRTGGQGFPPSNAVEAYSDVPDTWQTMASMATARAGLGVGAMNGYLFAVGGQDINSTYLSDVECYYPNNTWSNINPFTLTAIPPMPGGGRSDFTVAVVNGIIYVIGGTSGFGGYLNRVEAYNPMINSWSTLQNMPTSRSGLASGVVNGFIYAIGGTNGPNVGVVEVYNPLYNTWSANNPSTGTAIPVMPTSAAYFGCGVLNQTIYTIDGNNATASKVYAYDTAANSWKSQAGFPTSSNLLASGVVKGQLFAMGKALMGTSNINYMAVPVCATFTPTPVVPTPTTPPSCVSIKTTQTGGNGGFGTSVGNIAVDNTRGLYYVADRMKNRVQVYRTNGSFAGTIGGTGFTWGSANEFNDPYALAVDSQGYLYVGEYGGQSIKKIEPTTGAVLAVFGQAPGLVRTLTVDTNGDVYAGYQSGKVYIYRTPNYVHSYTSLTPSGLSDVNLTIPSGLLKVGNTLYATAGSNVLKYWITPGATYSWSYLGVAAGNLPSPFQMAIDTKGDIYVAIYGSAMLYVYDQYFNPIYQLQPSPGLNYQGVGVDASGYVYLAGSANNVSKVYQMVLCSAVVLPTPTPTPNCCQVVLTPTGTVGGFGTGAGQVAVDNTRGLYYVADRTKNRIQVFQTNGNAIGTIGGTGFTWGTANEFNDPNALAVDSSGYLYVGEYNGARVKKVEPTTGTLLATFGSGAGGVGSVRGLFVDTNRDVYVTSQGGKILVYNTPPYVNNYTQAVAPFVDTTNLGQTPSGVLKFTNSAGVSYLLVSTGAGNGSKEVMEYQMGPGYTFSATPALVTSMPYAYQMAKDPSGNIYVSSYNDGKFYVFNPNLEMIYSCQPSLNNVGIGVDGQGNVYLCGITAGQVKVYQETICSLLPHPTPTPLPNCCTVLSGVTGGTYGTFAGVSGVAVDNYRLVEYVADTGHNQIQMFGLLGSTSPLYNFGTAMQNGNLNGPGYLFMGPDANLYVCEYSAGDVKIVEPPCSDVCPNNFGCTNCNGILLNTIGSGIVWGYVRAVFVDSNLDMYIVSQSSSGSVGYISIYSQATTSWKATNVNLGALGATPSGILKIGNNLLISDGGSKVWQYAMPNWPTNYTLSAPTVAISLPLGAFQMALAPPGSNGAGNIYINSNTDGQFYVFNKNLEMIYKCQPTFGGQHINDTSIGVDDGGNVYLGGNANGVTPSFWQVQPCELFTPLTLAQKVGSGSGSKVKPFVHASSAGQESSPGLTQGQGSPTPTPTMTPTATPTPEAPAPLVVAAPNISRGGEPIKFLVHLDKPSQIRLSLFSVSGENVYEETAEGALGFTTINWTLQNKQGTGVASGLYIYLLQADDGQVKKSHTGKIAVFH